MNFELLACKQYTLVIIKFDLYKSTKYEVREQKSKHNIVSFFKIFKLKKFLKIIAQSGIRTRDLLYK